MKKLNKGKLSLDRETLAPLLNSDLAGVAGGAATITPVGPMPISSACTPIINTITRIFTR